MENALRAALTQGRDIFDPASGEMLASAIVARDRLAPGDRVAGPAVIVERETSTIVTSCFDAIIQHDGAILLVARAAGASAASPPSSTPSNASGAPSRS